MALHLKLDSNKILHKQFEGNKPGYNALQVDSFLDVVMNDYQTMEQYEEASEKKIKELTDLNTMLNERLTKEEAQLVTLNEKMKNIKSNDKASYNNIDLLKRISALETALYKAGIDPNTIS